MFFDSPLLLCLFFIVDDFSPTLLILSAFLCTGKDIDEDVVFEQHMFYKHDTNNKQWLTNVLGQVSSYNTMIVDGIQTCSKCFRAAYGVSRSTFGRCRQSVVAHKHIHSGRESGVSSCTGSGKSDELDAWLRLYARSVGDWMPHEDCIELPHYTKAEVFETYSIHVEAQCSGDEGVQKTKFYQAFKNDGVVRLRLRRTFKKCSTCKDFDDQITQSIDPYKRKELSRQKQDHLTKQKQERDVYNKHKQKARFSPDRYLSIIMDDMDQKKTRIPQTDRPNTAIQEAPLLRVHVTGVRVHGDPNLTRVYTWYDHFPADCNVAIECLLRVLQEIFELRNGSLPPVLYLQLDNCGVNKNRWVIKLLAGLVHAGLFKKIKMCFLIVGHTHVDIDQFFSCVSRKLRNLQNVHTLPDLHDAIRQCMLKAQPVVTHLDSVCDYKTWIDGVRGTIKGHSKPRQFRFRVQPMHQPGSGSVRLHVRESMNDPKENNPDCYEPYEGIDVIPDGMQIPCTLPMVPKKPLNITALKKGIRHAN